MSNLINLDVTTKASVLLEALPYIQRFRDAIFVVKYGGAFMDDANPEVRTRVATDIAFLHAAGIKVVVVQTNGQLLLAGIIHRDVEALHPDLRVAAVSRVAAVFWLSRGVDATRVHQRRRWVVSVAILSGFGRREVDRS